MRLTQIMPSALLSHPITRTTPSQPETQTPSYSHSDRFQNAQIPAQALAVDQAVSQAFAEPLQFHPHSILRGHGQMATLKSHFVQFANGEQVFQLLTQPFSKLTEADVKTVQRFLAAHTQVNLAYPGHVTGIDGRFGKRSHLALTAFLRLKAVNKVNQPLNQQTLRAQAHWALAQGKAFQKQLAQVSIGTTNLFAILQTAAHKPLSSKTVKNLQTRLHQAGFNLAYSGHATGIDGQFGRRSREALGRFLMQLSEPPSPSPTPAVLMQGLAQPHALLQDFGRAYIQLPETARARAANQSNKLVGLLKTAAIRRLNRHEVKQVQQTLVQAGIDLAYRGHATGIDGDYGKRTQQALLNQFNSWLLNQPLNKQLSGPFPQYAEMFKDGLLDMTVAVGYDEGNAYWPSANLRQEKRVTSELQQRGFKRDDARAIAMLNEQGIQLQGDYAAFYIKENVQTHQGQPVHAIVRVIFAGHGDQGARNRQAALEGMNQSDVFMYGGHARYGTGPDFDRNFTVTIDWEGVANAPTRGKVTYRDYHSLKKLLGPDDAAALKQIKTLEAAGRVTVAGVNDGNIRMSETNLHPYEFGAHLMDRALNNNANPLAETLDADRYRLWLFNGCRTRDYLKPLQQEAKINGQLKGEKLDVLTTEQSLYWSHIGESLMTFLDGVMAQNSSQDLVGRLRQANPEQAERPTHSAHGFADNPLMGPLKP